MHYTKAAVLFVVIGLSFAQLGVAPQHENGEAIVVNKCSLPVFHVSMGDSGTVGTLPAGGIYREQFRPRYLGDDSSGEGKYGGISIMLSLNQTIAKAADKQQAFFQSTITQFEYTYHPLRLPGLWYDISNVNGYVFDSDDGWNGKRPWPFQANGLIVEGTSSDCPKVVCPGGNPNGNSTCLQAYTHPKDDWASHGCRNSNSIVLTLCTVVSSLEDVINFGLTQSSGQTHDECL
ncbi:hypothetical protein V496_00604 [Pseudogymnoascus sp. VKM F-4515 (FW-2607)]|nr:hypothetical protein V496_00604 [Pseudogymnoascus sp. VKM F-4515 (FW-2607)]